MLEGRFILRKDRNPNQNGEYTILLQYSTQGVCVKTSTHMMVKPEFWLGDTGTSSKYILGGRNGHPKSDLMNQGLVNLKKSFDTIIDSVMVDPNCVMTVPTLRSILNGTYKEEIEKGKGRVGFVEHVLNYNHQLYELGKISYSVYHNIECNMNQFRRFIQKIKHRDLDKSTTLYCREITVELIKEYILWRKERGNTNDTINKSLTPIFKTLRHIQKKGWISLEIVSEICELYLPTQCQSLENPTNGKVDYLTEEQLKLLIKLKDQSKYPTTKVLMDMFLFSFHCYGLRFSDICTLRWSEIDFDNNMVHHLIVKNHTKRPIFLEVPINKGMLEILNRYKGVNDNFVFGQLDSEFNLTDEVRLKETINGRNKVMNTSLKCMGEKMGLPFRLHFHVARHTFGVWSLNRGVDIKTISQLMGHTTTMTTEKVYSKYLPSTLKTRVNELLNFNLEVENT